MQRNGYQLRNDKRQTSEAPNISLVALGVRLRGTGLVVGVSRGCKMSKQKRLTNLDYDKPEYWQDEPQTTAIVPANRQTFVPAPKAEPVVTRRMVEPIDINLPQQSTMAVDMRTSAVDRAQGFSIETHQLSIVVGALAVLIAVVGFGHPFLAMSTLWTFGIWYTIVWFLAWLFHRIVSPEGLAFFNAIMMWRYVNRRG